ncbi:hypothetical protein HWV23_06580 [Natronomonas halophila]|uniref:hypothetical protein n=1 Tax=Natronomonas halophila TaxID=2747817 RepID=UPI0015B59082|nr:hypothetical protein [Natronomonas halophila]QLD85407.1 hypothetical protein HWV23_06580 [Natronomonas halophila]
MLPLQAGPGPLAGVLGLLGTLIVLVIAFLVGRWVYRDAQGRGMNAMLWGLGTGIAIFVGLIPGIVVFAIYYVLRD